MGSGLVTDVPAGGITFANRDVFIDTGTSFTGTGVLTIAAGRTLGVRENYVINRPLVNHGVLAPGLALGVIGIDASYYQQFYDGTLNIHLGGTTADTGYDKLVMNGVAYLAGLLKVSTLNGFAPARGDSFTVLSAAAIVGGFNAYDLPQLASGQAWKIGKSSTAITLTVVQGDYTRDGVIDAEDYVLWRKTQNSTVTAWSGADGNGDGLITNADYTVWRSNLGSIGGGLRAAGSGASELVAASIPEPATMMLAASALLIACGQRRRSQSKNNTAFRRVATRASLAQ